MRQLELLTNSTSYPASATPCAPIGSRALACIIDWYLSTAISSIPFLLIPVELQKTVSANIFYGCMAIFLCSGYFILFPIFCAGRTPGKMLLHIQVVQSDYSQVTLWVMMKRELIGVTLVEGAIVASSGYLRELLQLSTEISILVPWSIFSSGVTIISVLIACFHKEHRAIHDFIGNTLVVKYFKSK